PISFSGAQADKAPRRWRQTLDTINEASARGLAISAQIAARPVGLLLGLELSRNPFQTQPSYKASARLPLTDRRSRRRHAGGPAASPQRWRSAGWGGCGRRSDAGVPIYSSRNCTSDRKRVASLSRACVVTAPARNSTPWVGVYGPAVSAPGYTVAANVSAYGR